LNPKSKRKQKLLPDYLLPKADSFGGDLHHAMGFLAGKRASGKNNVYLVAVKRVRGPFSV
jgi:hypothetical protein